MTNTKPFIIADIGSNHRGDFKLACDQIYAAMEVGCDAAKFQLYTHEELYGVPGDMPHCLPPDWVPRLKEHADKVGIEFMCSAFSCAGVANVDPYVRRHKLASSEMLHFPMLDRLFATGKPVIISTGGMSWQDVAELMDYALCQVGPGRITLLECVAQYPAPPHLYDVLVLRRWQTTYGSALETVGISDHTAHSATLAILAIGYGATVFEHHFDAVIGPATADTPVSYDRLDMADYVANIRAAFRAIGDGIKQPRQQSEAVLRYRRRPIVTRPLTAGDTLELGVNFGLYRSLKDDAHGGPTHIFRQLDGRRLTTDKRPGDSLWFSDVDGATPTGVSSEARAIS